MSVVIDQPEIEALIQQRLSSGGFHDAAEVLLYALKSAPAPSATASTSNGPANLVEVCQMVSGLTDGIDFSRNPSTGRPLDIF